MDSTTTMIESVKTFSKAIDQYNFELVNPSVLIGFTESVSKVMEQYQSTLSNSFVPIYQCLSQVSAIVDQSCHQALITTVETYSTGIEKAISEIVGAISNVLKNEDLASYIYQLEEEEFRSMASDVFQDFTSCDEIGINFEGIERINAAQAIAEKKHLSLTDICALLTLLVTIFMFIQSTLPDKQVEQIETAIKETISLGQELIELQEQEINLQIQEQLLKEEQKQTEIQQQQLEESQKQTDLLMQLSESKDKTD